MRRFGLVVVGMLTAAALAGSAGANGGAVRAVAVAGPRRLSGATHDVSVALGIPRLAADGARFRLVVRNRGRARERGVRVALWSDADDAVPLWTNTVRIESGGLRAWSLVVDVPDGATRLRAVAYLSGRDPDEAPEDNESVRSLAADRGDATRGGVLWRAQCASCHGAEGHGGSVVSDVAGATAARILRVAWNGAVGMPRFPSTTWTDAADLAAHLRDPVAVPDPEPAPIPEPAPQPEPCPAPVTRPTDGLAPTWTNRIAGVVGFDCLRCHSGATANRDRRFDSYEEVFELAPLMLDMIRAGAMPADGPMPAEDRRAFEDWVTAGRPR